MYRLKVKQRKKRDPRLDEIFRPGKWIQTPKAVLKAIISNDFRLSKNEIQVIIVILLKTWGFQKYSDRIARSQINALTGLNVSAISRAMRALRARQILVSCKDYSWKKLSPYELRIEDDTSKWLKRAHSDKTSRVTNHAQDLVTNPHRKSRTIHATTIDSEKEAFIEHTQKPKTLIKETAHVPIENRKARY